MYRIFSLIDHLDYKTILKLTSKIKNIFFSLGMSSHLIYWGFDEKIITEMDWWQTNKLDDDLYLTAAPAKHFSGRGIKRFKTLWSSFILKTSSHNLYLGGDSGYDTHFKEIGKKYGPFDIAILDLKARLLLPVHWGKFALAMHAWNEPVKRVLGKAKELNIKVTTPMIGEPVILGESYPDKYW